MRKPFFSNKFINWVIVNSLTITPLLKTQLKKYSFVLSGELRKRIVLALEEPKSPKQLMDIIKTQDSSVARCLKQLSKERIVKNLFPNKKKGRIYVLTKEGKEIRKSLEKR